jgi:hypothetical protein
MAVDGVHAGPKNRRALGGEFLGQLAEPGHFGRANEGEVGRIKE